MLMLSLQGIVVAVVVDVVLAVGIVDVAVVVFVADEMFDFVFVH